MDSGFTDVKVANLSVRLWRRYGIKAEILEDIRQDIRMAELVIEDTEYIRTELHCTAKSEMITARGFSEACSKILWLLDVKQYRTLPVLRSLRNTFELQQQYQEYFS